MFSGGARLWQTGARRGIMKSRIICLAPGRVAPGMALAAAAMDREGRILLATGTVLDTSMLDRLNRRGVEAIFVHLLDTRNPETIAHELQRAEARVAHIFRGADGPARQSLQNAILGYRRETTR
jgi:hypothetical protein